MRGHKAATAALTEVRRALEEAMVFNKADEGTIGVLRKKWDDADRQAPTIPSGIYNRIAALVGGLEHEESSDSSLAPVPKPKPAEGGAKS